MKKLLLVAVAVVWPVLMAHAEILIYDLSFNTAGPSVNYSFLQGGYLVVDAGTDAVTSIVTLTDPQTGLLYYMTDILSGTYMELAEAGSNKEYAVIYSTSGSGGDADNLAFQLLGKTSGKVNVGSGNALSIARKLKGYLLASAEESTSVETGGLTTITYGFAGTSKVTANYQPGLTKDANNSRLDAAATIETLTAILENQGVGPQPTPSPTATPTPTATP